MPDDIVAAAGEIQWLSEQPGRWHVEARQTHVVVSVPSGIAMLTVPDASLLSSAIQVALQLVHGAQARAEQAKAFGVQPMPGAMGTDG